LLLLLIGAVQGVELRRAWERSLDAVGRQAASLALVVEQDITRAFQATELSMLGIAEALDHAPRLRRDTDDLAKLLSAKLDHLPYISALRVVDRTGRVIASAPYPPLEPVSEGEQGYFRQRRDAPGTAMAIHDPARDPSTGTTFVPLTRRLEDERGDFAGIVFAALDPRALDEIYHALDLGSTGALSLFRTDATLLARFPHRPGLVGRRFSETPLFREHLPAATAGTFVGGSVVDGIERAVAYRKLARFAVVAAVGIDLSYARDTWRGLAETALVGFLVTALALALATVLLLRALARQRSLLDQARQSDQRFRDFAEIASDWLYEMDAAYRFTYISPRREEVTGASVQARLGRTPFELAPPEEMARHRLTYDRLRQVLDARQEFRGFEFWTASPGGEPHCVAISGRPVLGADGVFLGYRGTGSDLTERKRAERDREVHEARLAAILNALPASIALVDRDGRIVEVNRRWAGHAGTEALFGGVLQPGTDYLAACRAVRGRLGDAAEALAAGLEQVLAGASHAAPPIEYAADGDRPRSWYRAMIVPLSSRSLEGAVVMHVDVTDRRAAEEALAQAQKLEAVGQLTGGIAHDFNNLLTVILGQSDLLSADLAQDRERALMADTINAAARRGAELTRQLLAFARRQPLQPARLHIAALVESLLPMLRRTLSATIEVKVVLAADAWPCLADPAQLEAALLNLAINARDAMPNGGVLTIETGNAVLDEHYTARNPDALPGEYAIVSISDTGHGMAPEITARAFEPFFTTKPVGQGTGLGLSMVYGFVKQTGGHIKIYSEVGRGTTVKLYLPRAGQADMRPEPPPALPGAAMQGTESILVVEDDAMVREFTAAQLRRLGYRVTEARSGADALAILGQGAAVDLMLTDIVLPGGMTGRELSAEARRLRPSLKLLFTSGYTAGALENHVGNGHGVPLLVKPYRVEELVRRVREALDAG
jgi:PAS domain S-box-containing protein